MCIYLPKEKEIFLLDNVNKNQASYKDLSHLHADELSKDLMTIILSDLAADMLQEGTLHVLLGEKGMQRTERNYSCKPIQWEILPGSFIPNIDKL